MNGLIIKTFLISLLFFIFAGNCSFSYDAYGLRGYNEVEIPKGTFIPVINAQEISTQYFDEKTQVKFIAPNDMYMYETNVIPKNSQFYGYVEKINEPVIGTNASMVIKVTKLILPDGFELPLKGYIYTKNGNLIGGELTAPASYDKKPAYAQGFNPMVGYVPGATRKMGEHSVICSGANLMIILVAPLYVTHTVTD